MMAQVERCYGTIQIVRRGADVGYRVDGEDGQLLGYYRTLRASTKAAHTTYIAGHGPRGGANSIDRLPAPIGIYGPSQSSERKQGTANTPDRTERD
jgi:hypothetical protein